MTEKEEKERLLRSRRKLLWMRKSLLIRRLDEKIFVTIKIKENRGLVKDNEVLDGKVNDLGTEAVDSKKVVETLSN